MRADRETDALYGVMRGRFGSARARANGYRYETYFKRERALLMSLLDPAAQRIVDVACGSGLMLQPLLGDMRTVIGVDFNADACAAARVNGLPVIRGDAFNLPLASGSIDQLVNCQFFNQQSAAGVSAFVNEAARVLVPGGEMVLVWRNGNALIHRFAHACLTQLDRLRGHPEFPQVTHPLADVCSRLFAAGLTVRHAEVSCPPLAWRSAEIDSLSARLIGASYIVVAGKPHSTGTV